MMSCCVLGLVFLKGRVLAGGDPEGGLGVMGVGVAGLLSAPLEGGGWRRVGEDDIIRIACNEDFDVKGVSLITGSLVTFSVSS